MTDDRLASLEQRVYQLATDNARLAESVDHLAKSVTDLTGVVQGLRDTFNQGKGAIWLFGGLSAVLGGLISWATTHFFQNN